MNPKDFAKRLVKAAELMALAEAPGLTEVERVQLRHAADQILDECERGGFAVSELRRHISNRKLH